MAYSRFSRFLTSCAVCGSATSRAHARTHEGKCKRCASGVAPAPRDCADDSDEDEGDTRHTRLSYKQRHGRCEDAPCCGCCGPQGDGDYYGYAAMEASMEPMESYDF